MKAKPLAVHPGRLLKRELASRALRASRVARDLNVSSGRIADIINGRRAITADTAVRLGDEAGAAAPTGVDFLGNYTAFADLRGAL